MKRSLRERRPSLREAEQALAPVKSAGSFRVALCYPNRYSVGMSNLGLHVVYRLLNAIPEVVCERVFLPDPKAPAERTPNRRPLVSFETGTALHRFDAVAFSVAFENDYLNVLHMLHMAGIPLRTAARGPRDPLIILGGAAAFLNPEPLAPFADLIAVGEGETLVPAMMEALLGATELRRGLDSLRESDGFYVPNRYTVGYHADGTIAAYDGPGPIARQWAETERLGVPQSAFLTPHTEMSMRFLVEISRGCGRMCRFCWAGYHYLPVRSVARREIVARARALRPLTNRIGLVSTAVCDHPEIEGMVDDLADIGYQISVASLRLEDLSPRFVLKLADTGLRGLTLAPESGSDRLRRRLNKRFTNADIVDTAAWIFEHGILNLKLYFMVGLPFEEPPDIEAMVTLTDQIRKRMTSIARSRGRIGHLQISVNPFVPKPGTPFQWLPMADLKATDRKLRQLQRCFARISNVTAVGKSTRAGFEQAVLALGDRKVADALESACVHGTGLKQALSDVGLDPGRILFRERAENEILPWDIVRGGPHKKYLLAELERSRDGVLSLPCSAVVGCTRCGVCGDLSSPSDSAPAAPGGRDETNDCAGDRDRRSHRVWRRQSGHTEGCPPQRAIRAAPR